MAVLPSSLGSWPRGPWEEETGSCYKRARPSLVTSPAYKDLQSSSDSILFSRSRIQNQSKE